MLTNIINYEPKTDWENNCKVNMNIRDLQEKYPNGCNCCGKFYGRPDFSRMVASHFKTKKHYEKCLQVADEKFKTDFKQVSDINRDFEEKCKENRYLKQMIYELREENKDLKNQMYKLFTPISKNLIDI
tara:strand:+ start:1163 stop:1549 length:387 start_codon:yes stop_codon:yes gene_type:complete